MAQGDISGIDITPRDIALLRGLFETRIMTLAHTSILYFNGKAEMAKKRVQKLKYARLIRERPRRISEPSVLFLTLKAFRFLRENGYVADYPMIGEGSFEKRSQVSSLTVRHELEVTDVKTAIVEAVSRTTRFRVAEFSTWPVLYNFKAYRPRGDRMTVKPDGFIRIQETEPDGGLSEHTFFLEVDRSNEALEILADRAHCYLDYYRTGGLAVRYGRRADEYKQFGFRVLVVCKSDERQENLAMRLLSNTPPIKTQIWLANFAAVMVNPLGAIWKRPIDYSKREHKIVEESTGNRDSTGTCYCLIPV